MYEVTKPYRCIGTKMEARFEDGCGLSNGTERIWGRGGKQSLWPPSLVES